MFYYTVWPGLYIKDQLRKEYEVVYQPDYQAGYQPGGMACRAAQRMIQSLIRGLILDRVPHSRVVLYFFYLCTNF